MPNKIKLYFIGFLLCVLAIAVCAIGGAINEHTPGKYVSFTNIHEFVDQKVTIDGFLGKRLGFITEMKGGKSVGSYEEFAFYPTKGQQSGMMIELHFNSYKYPNIKEGDKITVTGTVGVKGKSIVYISVLNMYE